jgi:hypothetical protein
MNFILSSKYLLGVQVLYFKYIGVVINKLSFIILYACGLEFRFFPTQISKQKKQKIIQVKFW